MSDRGIEVNRQIRTTCRSIQAPSKSRATYNSSFILSNFLLTSSKSTKPPKKRVRSGPSTARFKTTWNMSISVTGFIVGARVAHSEYHSTRAAELGHSHRPAHPRSWYSTSLKPNQTESQASPLIVQVSSSDTLVTSSGTASVSTPHEETQRLGKKFCDKPYAHIWSAVYIVEHLGISATVSRMPKPKIGAKIDSPKRTDKQAFDVTSLTIPQDLGILKPRKKPSFLRALYMLVWLRYSLRVVGIRSKSDAGKGKITFDELCPEELRGYLVRKEKKRHL
ncbi:uncharacterized protein FOMMEDRAFT_155417 [Fomitiporia mediterranea MF3/22]|uniref:uncharacterized protein n=1 Tax=Fomitiporia mediterranea (strain MF3/22) TaxID=694068 RepID=UPI0004407F2E|nr:uncharacterized protein FOMMEDRAFT_155417 [Fomitiporia mediterranea MF3/22]EJD04293.1 hypothetical protein FOMMEDRAFT_155417 [Fomitiporia mediterranea MF3/22]